MVSNAVDCSAQGVLALAQGSINGNLQAYIVAQHVFEKPGGFSVYWAVKDDSPIKTVADLRGKIVGISAYGAGIYGPFALHLKRHGLDPEKDIRLVETGFSNSEGAIRTGRVDAGVLNQPFAARAEAKGGTRKLFAISDETKNMVHIMEVCRKDFTDANAQAVGDYVRDLTRAMGIGDVQPRSGDRGRERRDQAAGGSVQQLYADRSRFRQERRRRAEFRGDPGAARCL